MEEDGIYGISSIPLLLLMISEDTNNSEANEPQPGFDSSTTRTAFKKVIVFSTLEEQDRLTREFTASLSHVERMQYLQKLIRIFYGLELSQPVEKFWTKKLVSDLQT